MNKNLRPLLIAQFLSAFADNAILFTVIAMVMHSSALPGWYVPALQSAFLVAFVVLAPWVGGYADQHPKPKVLLVANLVKALGALLLLVKLEPVAAYCVVGAGAALYSPAKYGILPELASHDELVKANSWIEGSTILAIVSGTVAGAKLADYSVNIALLLIIILFIASAVMTLFLPVRIAKGACDRNRIIEFWRQAGQFFLTSRSRFAILAASLFWATAATLRVIIVAWAPIVLMMKSASEIANLTLFLALGIVAGSVAVPHLITLEHLRRVRFAAYVMAVFIGGLSLAGSLPTAGGLLFVIGMAGGIFIVPVNAALQEIGHKSIGSGSAVALQNFFQNTAMLLAVGAYTLAAANKVSPINAMQVLSVLVFLLIAIVALQLPKQTMK